METKNKAVFAALIIALSATTLVAGTNQGLKWQFVKIMDQPIQVSQSGPIQVSNSKWLVKIHIGGYDNPPTEFLIDEFPSPGTRIEYGRQDLGNTWRIQYAEITASPIIEPGTSKVCRAAATFSTVVVAK